MIKKILTGVLCLLMLTGPVTAKAGKYDEGLMDEIPIEAVICFPEKLKGKDFYTTGIVKQVEEGFLLYHSKNDYQYDTRENSILVYDINHEFRDNYQMEPDGTKDGFSIKNVRIEDDSIAADLSMKIATKEEIPQMPI